LRQLRGRCCHRPDFRLDYIRVSSRRFAAIREGCSPRHVNMTISLAFLAPSLVKAAVEGRLPRGSIDQAGQSDHFLAGLLPAG
jgi:hypothetical protein